MRVLTLFLVLSFVLIDISNAQSLEIQNWTYIQIDSTKQKWGDWNDPDWLRYFGLDFGDVNRDGNIDIISGRYIYHNPGGSMDGLWQRTVLDDNVDAIFSIDADGDQYSDIIAQALPDIYWYEAINEQGTQYKRKAIASIPATSHVNSQGFEKAQILPGGPTELLIAGNGNIYCISIPAQIQSSDQWQTYLIAENTSDEGIGVGDIDGDGDLDIACGRKSKGEGEPKILVWFENPGSIEHPWEDHVAGYAEHSIDRVEIADLTGDGHVEIIISEERYPGLEPDASLYWFSRKENIDVEWKKHVIVQQYSMNNLDFADIDNDSDIDIITNEHKGPRLELQLWENDGKANFTKHILDTGKENHLGTQFIDLDGDGDLDIAGSAWDYFNRMHVWRNDATKLQDTSILKKGQNTFTTLKTPLHNGKMMKIKFKKEKKLLDTTLFDYEGKSHYVIKTSKITYYFDIEGGGFSRIIDESGNDWISFKRNPRNQYPASAGSAFRGLPNLVYNGDDAGAGHPGHNKCNSWVEGNKIVTETKSEKWKWSWEFFDDHAILDIITTDPEQTYWFLYEGTPGGKFKPNDYYYGTENDGPFQEQHDFFNKEILFDQFQWMYAGNTNSKNVFYMIQMQKDTHDDLISYLGNSEEGIKSKNGMTVFGFGRDERTNPLLSKPQKFVIGFYPERITDAFLHKKISEFIINKFFEP